MDDIKSAASDLVKKVLSVGVGAVFLTEESLRNLVQELKVPKELIAGVLESAHKTKNEFLSKLSADLMERVGPKLDPAQLLNEVLRKNDIELSIKVKFTPKAELKAESEPVDGAAEQVSKV
jgi:hypothetical protein